MTIFNCRNSVPRSKCSLPFVVLTLMTLGFTLNSEAQSTSAFAIQPSITSPPESIGSGRTLRFSGLKSRYDLGLQASEQTLSGKWSAIAIATTEGCASIMRDKTDTRGLKNTDGSAQAELEFGKYPESEIPGDVSPLTFGVRIRNLGSRQSRQGPYRTNSTEPQFATWAYNPDGSLHQSTHFTWACRADVVNTRLLLCALSLRGKSPQDACSADSPGVMVMYLR